MTNNITVARNAPSTLPPALRSSSSFGPIFSGDVLIVEDNFIIAMDVEEVVTELGASTVHMAKCCDEALDIIDQVALSAAILDFTLEDGTSERVADALVARGVPFIFATGYSDASLFPVRYQAYPILTKPYSRHDIVAMFQTNSPAVSPL
ncbi:response regulator [Algimonas arctica]|uniref:Response regulator n=1 Tax=Algimonas arctica TaxID=1479486 RepID=A0A8J3CR62_9PROT|nr:response regulator [Algimonas arctica]GHA89662.1 response regulator [Algimonas arctica]